MNIGICDDNELILNTIEQYVCDFFRTKKTKTPLLHKYTNGSDFLSSTTPYDIVFLDMEMPDKNGIYVANELNNRNHVPIIIVITSFMEYLDDAMKFSAFRYLSKPIDKQRFFRSLNDTLSCLQKRNYSVPVETKDSIIRIKTSNIIAVEATNRKTILYTPTTNYHTVNNIDYWEKLLPQNSFYRTHRSYLVNMNHIKSFTRSEILLTINSVKPYLTFRKYNEFKKTYMFFLAHNE